MCKWRSTTEDINMTNKFAAFALIIGLCLPFAAPAFAHGSADPVDHPSVSSIQTDAPEQISSKGHVAQYNAKQSTVSQDTDRYNTP
jgi:hypothetical protein